MVLNCLCVDQDVCCFTKDEAVMERRLAVQCFPREKGDNVEVSASAHGSGGNAGVEFTGERQGVYWVLEDGRDGRCVGGVG